MNKFVAIILSAVVIGMLLVVAAYVNGMFSQSIDTSNLSEEVQKTINRTLENVNKGLQFGSIMPIVLLAGGVIAGITIGFSVLSR